MPKFEPEADEDGPVEAYFDEVRQCVDGIKRWRVRRWLTLGHFAFGRFAIYADLAPDTWPVHPATHRLIGAILRGTDSTGEGSLPSVPNDYPIDEPEIEGIAPVLIHDADASQHSALVDVMKGKDLVIQGPPGTGKSQTITNVIANALYQGRTVLFLAEKQAALDVVKRRLDKATLGDFCLELHSDKASPRAVIAKLKARCECGVEINRPHRVTGLNPTWGQNRQHIGAYVSALHRESDVGLTPFKLIWRSLRARTEIGDVIERFRTTHLPDQLIESPAEAEPILGELEIYAGVAHTKRRGQ